MSIDNDALWLLINAAPSPLVAKAILHDALRTAFERGYTQGYADGVKGAPIQPVRHTD